MPYKTGSVCAEQWDGSMKSFKAICELVKDDYLGVMDERINNGWKENVLELIGEEWKLDIPQGHWVAVCSSGVFSVPANMFEIFYRRAK